MAAGKLTSWPVEDFEPHYTFLLRLLRSFFGLVAEGEKEGKKEWATLQNGLLYQVD